MSILIKGVDMPEYTYAIKLTYFYADEKGNEVERTEIRTADQIIKVPTPHGRLIDGKLLFRKVEHNHYMWKRGYEVFDVLGDIEDAPTVIESED